MMESKLSKKAPSVGGSASSSHWKLLYQAALFELDPAKVRERIDHAQVAISRRRIELVTCASGRENQELGYAQRFLQLLEHETLPERIIA